MSEPENPGGRGAECAPDPSRSDLRLYARAFDQLWPMSTQTRANILRELGEIAFGDGASDRKKLMAFKVIIAADRLNVALYLASLKLPAADAVPSVRDVLAEAEAAADAYAPAVKPDAH